MFFNAEQWDDIHRAQYAAAMRVTPDHDDVQLTTQEKVAFWLISYMEAGELT